MIYIVNIEGPLSIEDREHHVVMTRCNPYYPKGGGITIDFHHVGEDEDTHLPILKTISIRMNMDETRMVIRKLNASLEEWNEMLREDERGK